jgi:hypothetical protein
MAPWLLGISSYFRNPRNRLTGKGLSGQRFEKQREVEEIDSESAADFRDCQAPRVCGRMAARMLCCREPLAALPSLQMKVAEKGESSSASLFSAT